VVKTEEVGKEFDYFLDNVMLFNCYAYVFILALVSIPDTH
jgi:hypothetical protein